jgi:hypothetical protein
MVLALLITFIILQILDGVITYAILSKGGKELNPFIKILMDGIGVIPALILSKGLLIAMSIFYYVLTEIAVLYVVFSVVNVGMAIVVILNARVLSNIFKR